MKSLIAVLAMCLIVPVAHAQNADYVKCIDEQRILYEDYRSDAQTIASAIYADCARRHVAPAPVRDLDMLTRYVLLHRKVMTETRRAIPEIERLLHSK